MARGIKLEGGQGGVPPNQNGYIGVFFFVSGVANSFLILNKKIHLKNYFGHIMSGLLKKRGAYPFQTKIAILVFFFLCFRYGKLNFDNKKIHFEDYSCHILSGLFETRAFTKEAYPTKQNGNIGKFSYVFIYGKLILLFKNVFGRLFGLNLAIRIN